MQTNKAAYPIVDAVAEEIKEEANADAYYWSYRRATHTSTAGTNGASEPANPPQAREGRGSNNAKPLF